MCGCCLRCSQQRAWVRRKRIRRPRRRISSPLPIISPAGNTRRSIPRAAFAPVSQRQRRTRFSSTSARSSTIWSRTRQASGPETPVLRTRDFTTTSSGLTEPRFPIPAAFTFTAPAAGAAALKSRPRIRISTRSRMCPMARSASSSIFPRATRACAGVSCTRRPGMTRTLRNAIPCCTCSTAAVRTRPAGPIRAGPISSWTT